MSIQTLISLVNNTVYVQNALIVLMVALMVVIVFKASVKRQAKKRQFNGYIDRNGKYRKAVNRKAKSPSRNGTQWHSGSYDGRKRR